MPTVDGVIAQLRTPWKNMPSYSVEQVSDEEAAQITEFLLSQISAPADLPKAGGEAALSPMIWLLVGLAFVLLGLFWRRLASRRQERRALVVLAWVCPSLTTWSTSCRAISGSTAPQEKELESGSASPSKSASRLAAKPSPAPIWKANAVITTHQ